MRNKIGKGYYVIKTQRTGNTAHGILNPTVLKEVLVGLSKTQKSLPPKLLYDKRGSELFEKICQIKEYYPTRAETEILKNNSNEISRLIGPDVLLIEPGSGSGDKIRFLLPHLNGIKAYVPIEISRDILLRMTEELHEEFPGLKVIPVCNDFNKEIELPLSVESQGGRKVVFFPGSTIGNFDPPQAVIFLKKIAKLAGSCGGLLIGVDLKKSPEIILNAYNDPNGVTADFNLNLLERINREEAANFDVNNFFHTAFYDEKNGRIEMHLVSKIPQLVRVHETVFRFREGESIHTESSYKYSVEEFTEICAKARFRLQKLWKDHANLFCLYYFDLE